MLNSSPSVFFTVSGFYFFLKKNSVSNLLLMVFFTVFSFSFSFKVFYFYCFYLSESDFYFYVPSPELPEFTYGATTSSFFWSFFLLFEAFYPFFGVLFCSSAFFYSSTFFSTCFSVGWISFYILCSYSTSMRSWITFY